MKRICILLLVLLLGILCVPTAAAEGKAVSIRELRESMPARWDRDITTNDGEEVSINAPINIPDVESFPILLCETQAADDRFDFQEGSDKDLYGKTDVYVRPSIYNPAEFPDMEISVDDVLRFIRQKLDSEGLENVDFTLYRYNALGPLCKTKSIKHTKPDGKVSFRVIVADPENPWKNNDTHGWKCTITQKINGIPVFLTGTVAHSNSVYSYATMGYTKFINKDLYMLWMCTVQPTETVSPDTELLSREALFSILEQRVREDQLHIVVEMNLGYFCIDQDTARKLNVAPSQDFEYMLLPVWQIRGYDAVIDPILDGSFSDLPFDEDVLFDPDGIFYLLLDARTGEVINYYPDDE